MWTVLSLFLFDQRWGISASYLENLELHKKQKGQKLQQCNKSH